MKKFLIILKVICIYIVIAMYIRVGFCIYNTNYNSKLDLPVNSDGYILNQAKLYNFRFGVLNANKNCCGAIATYNFLKLNNRNPNFKNILSIYDIFGTNVYGTLGINPFTIQSYLKLNGFNAKISVNTLEFNYKAKHSKTSILVYLYKWGGHYITLNYDKTTDMFETYNYNYGYITNISSLDDVLKERDVFSGLAMLIYV